ncbi:DUF4376 domain-containing protein, partial [Mannheimia haemolytica]|nr:DUF4376 domain-containing protein [Mannheimia haemolytica]MDW1158803.1 DUF4376 domain-containing protein [Mannheimia haemolytica]
MRVYFKKSNLKEYVIWPVPTNTKDYYQVEVDSESDLYGKTAVKTKNGIVLVEPAPTSYHKWSGTEWIISPEQQAIKKNEEIAIMRERINALRDEKSAGGVFVEQLGKWFDSDDKAQKKLLGLKATMDLIGTEMTVDWTCADNTDFEGFGKAHLTAVIAAILQAENHNHTIA